MASEPTKAKVQGALEEALAVPDSGFSPLQASVLGTKAQSSSYPDLVSVFMEMAWDLPSFSDWVRENIQDPDDAKALLGEAHFRAREWDT